MPNFNKRIVSERMEYTIPGRAIVRGSPPCRATRPEGVTEKVTKDGWKTRAAFATKMAMLEYGWTLDEESPFYIVLTIRVGLGHKTPRGPILEAIRRGEILPIREPNVDRILNLTMDALTGVVWKKKAQVIGTMVLKKYINKTKRGKDEGVEVLIGRPQDWKELNHDLRNA